MSILPYAINSTLFVINRYTSGIIGIGIRYVLLKILSNEIGDNVSVFQGCCILFPENIKFGNNVSIQPNSYLDGEGQLIIGNNVSIAHGVSILTKTHNYKDLVVPIKDQGETCKSVTIGDGVWIGAKATILCGVVIKSGAIIGANAVVTHDVQENDIVVGVPAKVIKKRG